MKKILVTNNSLVHANYKDKLDIIYSNNYSYLDILGIARDKIHEGYRLLTHPLSGSVKPNETPYKSLAISSDKGELDLDSLSIIEASIETAKKFIEGKKTPQWTEKILQDFELIDFYLIRSAVESMDQFS
ncbi:hypothetical protein SAMN02745975_01147 [Geosporobacter subterraneus DSM 17957]|uniref:GrdX protein n=1 Tax=Geosporobacter subterraneus DSM 17957 TaxID=1121919 RepID=A0A1M6G399_9FIRM|nr:GrdX family protein [Geosporobacter subterraneus]SHJ04297.1 hypothetical protein SAMN02745975_01147 [Geosporobacter subterraneus DSM 17957]